jgi:hypothetical protein
MRLVTRVIEHDSRSDFWWLRPLGDFHLGSVNCDEAQLDKDIRWILEHDALWIGMGDYCEFISRKDRRFRPEDQAEWLQGEGDVSEAQLQRLVSKLQPIKDKCVGLVKGNHEDQIYDIWDNDVYGRLLYYLKVPEQRIRLDTRGFVRLLFRRLYLGEGAKKYSTISLDIFAEHGYGGGRLEGAPALALARLSKNYQARIFIEGHRHREMSFTDERVRVRGRKLMGEKLAFVCSGSYLLSWKEDSEIYAERKQYPPKPTGSPIIRIVPWADEIEVTI